MTTFRKQKNYLSPKMRFSIIIERLRYAVHRSAYTRANAVLSGEKLFIGRIPRHQAHTAKALRLRRRHFRLSGHRSSVGIHLSGLQPASSPRHARRHRHAPLLKNHRPLGKHGNRQTDQPLDRQNKRRTGLQRHRRRKEKQLAMDHV